MTPTPEQRIAFASGLAHLLLKHCKLTPEDRTYTESVRDAQTSEAMDACWLTYSSSWASAPASAFASASAYAYAYASASVFGWDSAYASACRYAVKAGVPQEQVDALRALTLGVGT